MGGDQEIYAPVYYESTIQGCCLRKTILAILLFLWLQKRYQANIMVPTEVLANSIISTMHFCPFSMCRYAAASPLDSQGKEGAYDKIKDHEIDIVVGTML